MTGELNAFFENFALFQSAIFASVIAGFVLGAIGIYVAAQRIVFVSAALSQTASFGVVFAFWLHIIFDSHNGILSPSIWAFLMAFVSVVFLERAKHPDGFLGILFVAGSAGTLALSTRVVEELQDVSTLLFGTAVAVPDDALMELTITLTAVFLFHVWWFRGFTAVSIDSVGAAVRKMPTHIIQLALLATIALAIAVTTRVLGALPAFAFSVVPGLIGVRIASTFRRAFWIAAFIGAIGGGVGYIVAYLFDLPVGASQALVLIVFYGLGTFLHRKPV